MTGPRHRSTGVAPAALLARLAEFAWPQRRYAAGMIVATVGKGLALAGALAAFQHLFLYLLNPTTSLEFARIVSGILVCYLAAAVAQFLAENAQRTLAERTSLAAFAWSLERFDRLRTRESTTAAIVRLDKLQQAVEAALTASLTLLARGNLLLGLALGMMWQHPRAGLLCLAVLLAVGVWNRRRQAQVRDLTQQEIAGDIGFAERIDAVFASYRRQQSTRAAVLEEVAQCAQALAARSLALKKSYFGIGTKFVTMAVAGVLGLVLLSLWLGAGHADMLMCFLAVGVMVEPLADFVRAQAMLFAQTGKLDDWLVADADGPLRSAAA